MVVDILLGCDGDAVASRGTETPIVQGLEHLAVDCRSQALDHNFLDNVALFVDRDFDNDISLKTAQFVRRDVGIGRDYRKRRADFFSGQRTFKDRAQRGAGRTGLSSLPGCAGLVVHSDLGAGQLACGSLGRLGPALPGEMCVQLLARVGCGSARGSIGLNLRRLVWPIKMRN